MTSKFTFTLNPLAPLYEPLTTGLTTPTKADRVVLLTPLTNGSKPAPPSLNQTDSTAPGQFQPSYPMVLDKITRATPIFLTFIELIINLPYAIARNAIPAASAYWYKMLKDWKSLSSNKFIPKNAPFPKCDSLC